MAGRGSVIPEFCRPVTVEFIDHHLQDQHQMFVSPPVRWDGVSQQYAPRVLALAPPPDGDDVDELPPRPDWANTKAMEFWNQVFPDAMTEFKQTNEPRGRSSTEYSIRSLDNWDEIYRRLEAAQAKYEQVGGPAGWLRRVRRTVANHITPASGAAGIAAKISHGEPIATPVLAAVGLVLDAVKTAASVRQQALNAFEGLIPIFSDVELFIGSFPGDLRIRKAAVDLIVTTLNAIESTIGFFISNELLRGGKALLNAGDYEKSMVESLGTIKTRSSNMMEEAAKSHIHRFDIYSRETRKFHRRMVQGIQNVTDGMNSLERLFAEHLLRKDRELEATRQENMRLHIINERLRAITPTPEQAMGPYISPEVLRRMLDRPDLDIADLAFVADKKMQLPESERVQAEQIVNTQLFQKWVVSTTSSKLLVQWDFNPPQTIAEVSPLSVFCATMTKALRTKERFLSVLWFCGQHIDPYEPSTHIGGGAMLSSMIDQLIRQHIFDTRPMYSHVDIAALQAGRQDALIQLLSWLVRQLPEITTLFFIVDGIYLFERDEFRAEALPIFLGLIRLAEDRSVPATIKLLLTSTPGTDIVRGAFEEEDLILNVNGLPQLGWAPSDERMVRELEGEMEEAAWN
ncbi:hypothetical protein QBC34DRAFT_410940 [Podospora aff. communis PSN243]|uniref:Fungal STAND N-terminal Goodbye domain-containing protein n=1 Tax=Podospora aff. communis PSN243 TaxID=3040156 RepID=A0AAV9GFD3_9PEZI|nr:hypothetical protein QBC34DRAFT_410940 [Podospora aff. communis PSN243]